VVAAGATDAVTGKGEVVEILLGAGPAPIEPLTAALPGDRIEWDSEARSLRIRFTPTAERQPEDVISSALRLLLDGGARISGVRRGTSTGEEVPRADLAPDDRVALRGECSPICESEPRTRSRSSRARPGRRRARAGRSRRGGGRTSGSPSSRGRWCRSAARRRAARRARSTTRGACPRGTCRRPAAASAPSLDRSERGPASGAPPQAASAAATGTMERLGDGTIRRHAAARLARRPRK